ncbi:MAG: GNAT family N-acetyltransferase [Candidatus Lokiarchaeota archaeon]|nr:GNAT family N-acetyltransferase [Candidatus Lokiarchaeota archaeon]
MTEDKPIIFIRGENVSLVPLNIDHVEQYTAWKNDVRVRVYARNAEPITVEQFKKSIEPKDEGAKKEITMEIWHNKDKKAIGSCGFFNIRWFERICLMGLKIGEPEYWEQSHATEATSLLIDYGFKELNFHKIYAYVFTPNVASWKCAEKNGLTREAILKKDTYINGKYEDTYVYSILKEDWLKIRK